MAWYDKFTSPQIVNEWDLQEYFANQIRDKNHGPDGRPIYTHDPLDPNQYGNLPSFTGLNRNTNADSGIDQFNALPFDNPFTYSDEQKEELIDEGKGQGFYQYQLGTGNETMKGYIPEQYLSEHEAKRLDSQGVAVTEVEDGKWIAGGPQVAQQEILTPTNPDQGIYGGGEVKEPFANPSHGPDGRPIFKHPDKVTDLSHGPEGRPKFTHAEVDKRGWFKKQWDKFTDKDSTAPRNLLDFGMAMMERSEGAGDNFLKVVGQATGDTIGKADARKLAALQTAKDDAKAKLDKADTLTSIQNNIIDTHKTEWEDQQGNKGEDVDWNAVALAMREADPDGMFWNDDYLAHMVNNKIGMPEYNSDEEAYKLPTPNNQENINVYNNNLASILMMNADKQKEDGTFSDDVKIIVGDRIMTLNSVLQAGDTGIGQAFINQKEEEDKKKPWYYFGLGGDPSGPFNGGAGTSKY